MKKLLSILLVLTFVLALCSCTKENISYSNLSDEINTSIIQNNSQGAVDSSNNEETTLSSTESTASSKNDKTKPSVSSTENTTNSKNNGTSEIEKGPLLSYTEENQTASKITDILNKNDGSINIASVHHSSFLFVGEKTECRVEFSAIKPIAVKKWEVEKPDVATIDEQGVLTAIGPGQTKVFATLENGQVREAPWSVWVRNFERNFYFYENTDGKPSRTMINAMCKEYSFEITQLYKNIINKNGVYGSETSNKSYHYKGQDPYYPIIIQDSRYNFFGYLTSKDINNGYTLQELTTLFNNPDLYPGPDLYMYSFTD